MNKVDYIEKEIASLKKAKSTLTIFEIVTTVAFISMFIITAILYSLTKLKIAKSGVTIESITIELILEKATAIHILGIISIILLVICITYSIVYTIKSINLNKRINKLKDKIIEILDLKEKDKQK